MCKACNLSSAAASWNISLHFFPQGLLEALQNSLDLNVSLLAIFAFSSYLHFELTIIFFYIFA